MRSALTVMLGVAIGALPLICYNIHDNGATLKSNTHLTTKELKGKFEYLRMALDGSVAAVAMSDERYAAEDRIRRPLMGFARWWDGNSPWQGNSWRQWLLAALLPIGLVCASPSRRKWIVFFAGSAVISWLQSALTINGGQSIHHNVLIWPLLYVGAALCADAAADRINALRRTAAGRAASPRWGTVLVAGVTALFCYRGLFLINHAYCLMLTFGPTLTFTNADVALVSYLREAGVHRVATLDGAIANPLVIRTANTIPVLEDTYTLIGHGSIKDDLLACAADPACAVVTHPDSRLFVPGATEIAQKQAAGLHLRMTRAGEIPDSHGVPTFEIYRIESASGSLNARRAPR